MISLKKHIDSHDNEVRRVALDCYRETLVAMGRGGEKALPLLGPDFSRNLNALADRISHDATPAVITDAQQKLLLELDLWGEHGVQYFKDKTREVKEILLAVASSAEAVGERDLRYSVRLSELTSRLGDIAHLEDISAVRASLVESAGELTACIARMTEEGRESTSRLRAEVDGYRVRLEEAERQGRSDMLTGLVNRAACELALTEQISHGETFCVLFLDLNGFKTINDSQGHSAGDDLLRKFAKELRAQVRPTDLVGRWGGDEFICIIQCRLAQLTAHLDRIAHWVFGEYKLDTAQKKHKVQVTAAVGFAEWNGSENAAELVARADTAMYSEKRSSKR